MQKDNTNRSSFASHVIMTTFMHLYFTVHCLLRATERTPICGAHEVMENIKREQKALKTQQTSFSPHRFIYKMQFAICTVFDRHSIQR